jgi:hypothetical protein
LRLLGVVAAALAIAAGGCWASTAAAKRTVHLRGTAYEFNNVRHRLGGAAIRVAERPRLKATTRADGTYDLVVPDGARITPFIVAAGYHTIYLQTFTTAGEDLANVNFQTPTVEIYKALAALLEVPLDANGELAQCAIVSTFSTRNVRDLGFAGFIGYGAHGIAGATATTRPSLPAPVYFNESVIPDRTQPSSSKDGGVVWTRVPTGTYTVAAHHPTTRFASFVATCRPGRIVNANPPWGLHELAPPMPADVTAAWSRRGSRLVLRSLTARGLPAKAVVTVRCTGSRCPFTARTVRPASRTADLLPVLGNATARLRARQTLEVRITAHAYDGKVFRWAIGATATPQRVTLCVPLGNTRPQRC